MIFRIFKPEQTVSFKNDIMNESNTLTEEHLKFYNRPWKDAGKENPPAGLTWK